MNVYRDFRVVLGLDAEGRATYYLSMAEARSKSVTEPVYVWISEEQFDEVFS